MCRETDSSWGHQNLQTLGDEGERLGITMVTLLPVPGPVRLPGGQRLPEGEPLPGGPAASAGEPDPGRGPAGGRPQADRGRSAGGPGQRRQEGVAEVNTLGSFSVPSPTAFTHPSRKRSQREPSAMAHPAEGISF